MNAANSVRPRATLVILSDTGGYHFNIAMTLVPEQKQTVRWHETSALRCRLLWALPSRTYFGLDRQLNDQFPLAPIRMLTLATKATWRSRTADFHRCSLAKIEK